MSDNRPRRVMWLLNHTGARTFEVPMLKRSGYAEVYLPKTFPEFGFRSASVDFSEDANLTIPPDDLALLNATDWYREVPKAAWDVANRHFETLFFIQFHPEFIRDAAKHFHGVLVWRAYGYLGSDSYDRLLRQATRDRGPQWLKPLGERLVFATAYEHLERIEPDYLRRRAIFLPLGMTDCQVRDEWTGSDERLLFVCPEIESNPHYARTYEAFHRDFGNLPHAVAGVQPIRSERANVLGFLPRAEYEKTMQQLRVMYYHSREPNQVHYHPFEAIRAGMPLVFMGGGMLDRLGGENLPGRARSTSQARRLIERLQAGDQRLADRIRATQQVLLRSMEPERLASAWARGVQRVAEVADRARKRTAAKPTRKRVAVLLPIAYRGGSFNGIKLVAAALHHGAQTAGDAADVVLGYPEDGGYQEADFADLPKGVSRRSFHWLIVGEQRARRMMAIAGDAGWSPTSNAYLVPDDGISTFFDCDVWLIVSDRLTSPPLPMRPTVTLIYDYVLRYFELNSRETQQQFLTAGHSSDKVLTTTEFTRRDAIQFGTIPGNRVSRVPMIGRHHDDLGEVDGDGDLEWGPPRPYFLWTTNAGPHKNHLVAAKALDIYYNEMDGQLQCVITGVETHVLLMGNRPHLVKVAPILERLTRMGAVAVAGDMPEGAFARRLAGAQFLWHPAKVDNGTFSVVEAAYLGVPSLSTDYPAMREIDAEFGIFLSWSPAEDEEKVAEAIKRMERNASIAAQRLPDRSTLDRHSARNVGLQYWNEVASML